MRCIGCSAFSCNSRCFISRVFGEKLPGHRHIACREMIAHTMACRTGRLMCILGFFNPLPATGMVYRAAVLADRGLGKFALGLVAVHHRFQTQPVPSYGLKARGMILDFHKILLNCAGPRHRAGAQQFDYVTVTLVDLALACTDLGSVTLSMPSLTSALTALSSTLSGKRKLRMKLP